MPEPEFWFLLILSLAVASVPASIGVALFGLGIYRKSIALKICGGIMLGLGGLIALPMGGLLLMWIVYWVSR